MVSEMTTYVWNFGSDATGLKFSVSFDGSQFTVTVETGYLNVNALWFSDGGSSSDGFTLVKADSSLNMNGSNTVWAYDADGNPITTSEKIVWDEYLKVSSPGLTSTPPDSYIVAGTDHCSFTISVPATGFDFVIDQYTTLGVRATSTSGATGGSIKWVDAVNTTLNQVPVASDDAFTVAEANIETATDTTKHLVGNVITNAGGADSDVDGDALTVTAITAPIVTEANPDLTILSITAVGGQPGEVARYQITTNFGDAYLSVSDNGAVHLWSDNGEDPFQALGSSASAAISFTYTLSDGSATDPGAVTVTITGTNDQPTLTITDAAAALSEGDGAATLSDSGALSFADLDANDAVTVSKSYNDDIVWSGGALSPAVATALVAGFSVDQDSWDYSASQNLDFLRAGETITFSYDVVATDDSGAGNAQSAAQTVTVTITGTNDAAIDLNISVTADPSGNSLPNGNFAQLSAIDPDGGGAHVYSLQSLAATTLSGGTATNFNGDLSVSNSGVVSASQLDDNRIYSMQVQVEQDGATFNETFTIITGTNAVNSLNGSGDDLIFGLNNNDTIFAGSGNDTVMGQVGDDRMHGGTGNDVLTGGNNNDTFVFDTALDASNNVDTITDFQANNADKVELAQPIFAALSTTGPLAATNFSATAGGNAADADDFILYDTATGNLYYDADGNGGSAKILFATLTVSGGSVDAADFRVIA